MSSEFYSGTDWQQSSTPSLPRKVHRQANDDTDLLWPQGGNWDALADGLHPVLAIGRKANRSRCITGVMMAYDSDTEIAMMDVADKKIVRAYVANIAGYSQAGTANSWQNTIYPGDPVFVDDDAAVYGAGAGVTLTFSPTNGAGENNPLAGYVFWCQDEYEDNDVGGPNTTQDINQPAADDTTEVLTLCVMIVNDCGPVI